MTVGEAVLRATQALEDAGSDEARLEAEVLVMHQTGLTRAALFKAWLDALSPQQETQLQTLVARRKQGEPLAYITGHREFYGLDFFVDNRVLIPRPDTELLVEAALKWLRAHTTPLTMADIGVGSGAIAISVTVHWPGLTVYAVDASAGALEVAAGNVATHNVADRVRLVRGDLLTPLPGLVDLIVANLPYLRDDQVPAWCGVGSELAWEPLDALAAGPDGLDALRRFFHQAPSYLRPGGALFAEIGFDQGEQVMALARSAFPQGDVGLLKDLAGLDRVVRVQT